MPITVENNEIHRTVLTFEEVLNQTYYESHNSRTYSSFDSYSEEVLCLNFKKKLKLKSDNLKNITNTYISEVLSNQRDLEKIDLPIYYSDNKSRLNELYMKLMAKRNVNQLINDSFVLLCDNISEINFSDVHLEITKANLIKITALIDNNKILIISKDVSKMDTDIIYSYFINKQLIASDVSEIKIFINKFKEYLSL